MSSHLSVELDRHSDEVGVLLHHLFHPVLNNNGEIQSNEKKTGKEVKKGRIEDEDTI